MTKRSDPAELLAAHKAAKSPRRVLAYQLWHDRLSQADQARLRVYLEAFSELRDQNYGWPDLHALLLREWPEIGAKGLGHAALVRWCRQTNLDLFPELEHRQT